MAGARANSDSPEAFSPQLRTTDLPEAAEEPPLPWSRIHGKRGRFVDDQAVGELSSSSAEGPPDSSPDRPLRKPTRAHHLSAEAAQKHSSSASSDSDRPLAAVRHRSASLERRSPPSDNDFSSADSPDEALMPSGKHRTQHAPQGSLVAKQRKQKKRWRNSEWRPRSNAKARATPSECQRLQHDKDRASNLQQSRDAVHEGEASLAGATQWDDAEDEDGALDSNQADMDTMIVQEEEGPAFELPSQTPRELQSWAWDK